MTALAARKGSNAESIGHANAAGVPVEGVVMRAVPHR